MLNLMLVRHGHTQWHDTGKVAGRTDIDLSDAGSLAVRELAKSGLACEAFDSWHSSPLLRTRCTSKLLRQGFAGTQTLPAEELDERLVELDFGRWEGMTWQSVHETYTKDMALWGEDWLHRAPTDGETFVQQARRCERWLVELLNEVKLCRPTQSMESRRDHTALVVTHGGSIRALVCHCLGWPLTRAMDFKIDPASVTHLELETQRGQWTLRAMNSQTF